MFDEMIMRLLPNQLFCLKSFFFTKDRLLSVIWSLFFDEEASNKLTKATPKSYKELQQGFGSSSSYRPSKCSKFLTTGGETPRHTWPTLLQWANRASSCATLLKSRFRCRICQLIKPSRKLIIPLTMWPKPPLQSLDRMRWTV